jgi:hypothetical protein
MKFETFAVILPVFLAFSAVMTTLLSFLWYKNQDIRAVLDKTKNNKMVDADAELIKYAKDVANQESDSDAFSKMTVDEFEIFKRYVRISH